MSNQTTSAPLATARLPIPFVIAATVLLLIALAITVPFNPEWWKIIILGVVQGITEWLPISSTGHLLITSKLLGFEGSIGGTFEIAIQFGTVIAVVVFYLNDLLAQARAVIGQADTDDVIQARRLWLSIVIATIPAAAIGIVFREQIKAVLFDTPQLIAGALIIGGVIFLLLELLPTREAHTGELGDVTLKQAIGIGIAQIFALIPGVSRSGASIVGGLLAGLDRRTATAFSFYLSIPTLGGATLVDLLSSLDQITAGDWGNLLLGAVVAMIVGYLTIGWLLRYIANHSFAAFGVYRILAGVIIFGLVAAGWLA
ncbi:MAG: undecaprenyl-diphosphate phosphatase [Oscillochloris sp.]|nr:undecaprenyl-diphosphate phosphatase [Oscillochloris sp.]